jgi:transposase InsO family protein
MEQLRLPFTLEQAEERCVMVNAQPWVISQMAVFGIKICSFSWKHRFLILDECPIPCVLGVDFMIRAKMQIDFSTRRYGFAFHADQNFQWESYNLQQCAAQRFPSSNEPVTAMLGETPSPPSYESADILDLLRGFPALFSGGLGSVRNMVCHLDLIDNIPVRSRPYQCSPPRLQQLRDIVDDLLDKGVIRKSYSQYASPAFLVPKPSGGQRMVIDYRRVNQKIRFDAFPMPNIECAFAYFNKATIFSVLDLNSAYYQIPLSAKSRKVTAFCTPFGLFEFTKLPMGVSVGCQVLSRVVDTLFGDLKCKFVYNFMDDLVVYSRSRDEHLQHLKEVFSRLQRVGFTLNRDKLRLAQREIPFLGHLLSADGVRILPERVEAISSFPPPTNLRAVRRFLGMASFYGRFIPRFSHLAEPLHALKRKNVRFEWKESHQEAFLLLKRALATPPVLQIPDFSAQFSLACDASDVAISAVLQQQNGDEWAPLAYASRLLSPAERRYSTHEKECLAIVWGCEKYRMYLEHKEFILFTDNQALAWLLSHAKELGRIGRWLLRLAPFKFRAAHISGKVNSVADCLTRQYEQVSGSEQLSGLVLGQLPEAFHSIAEYQKKDPFCVNIYQKVLQQDPTVKQFKLLNGTLVYQPSGTRVKRYLLPEVLRPMIYEYFHQSLLSAHLGVTKTLNRIARVFYWPNMRKEVAALVRGCQDCQRAKPAQDARVGLHSAKVMTCPMERVFVDFVGPIVRSRKGNIAILVVLDGFSKFVSLYPVRRISAEVVKTCFVERFFPSFGVPQEIVSDNATVFMSKTFFDLCFSWGIRHITTSPYYPQASQVERFNRNLKVALSIYHHHQHTHWDEHLASLALAFNTAWHESTAATPASLFLGRELNHPLGLKWELAELDMGKEVKDVREFWRVALQNLRKAHARVAERYNRARRQVDFRVSDLVLLRLHPLSSKSGQRSAKLDLRWSAPLRIVNFVSPVTVQLANPDTGVIVRKAHVSQLKPHFSVE